MQRRYQLSKNVTESKYTLTKRVDPNQFLCYYKNCSQGSSSIGRASVSKTEGCGFDSCLPCHFYSIRTFSLFRIVYLKEAFLLLYSLKLLVYPVIDSYAPAAVSFGRSIMDTLRTLHLQLAGPYLLFGGLK